MNPPQRCTIRLADKLIHSPRFVQYFFEFTEPASLKFDAGQYVSLQVSEHGHRRSYSICSSPAVTHGFELLVDHSPHGIGTTYLENIPFGQEIPGLFPLGVFTCPNLETEKSLVFIATGSGITPFRSMVLDLLQVRHDQRPITLYWGMRQDQEFFWLDEFMELANAFPNFKLHPVVSQPTEGWSLCRGRVTDCLRAHSLPEDAGFYLCGNAAMIKDTIALLSEMKVPAERIHHEKFY